MHEKIIYLTQTNRDLEKSNKRLHEQLELTREENQFLMKNAEQEITKISEFIDLHRVK